jgi:hypothetical protein
MAGSRVMSTTSAPRRRHRLAALVTVAVLALSGCGLRLETPDPTEPTPDAAEALRAGSVDDALALAAGSEHLLAGADPAVAPVLTLVHDAASAHVTALGGEYDSGLPEPTPSPSTTTAPVADAPALLTLLGSTAVRARSDALAASDSGTARLLAAIAAARAQQATQLATALGTDVPAFTADASETSDPADTAGPADTATSTATDGDGSGSGAGAATTGTPALGSASVTALTLAEDQAGYGYEVAAARLSDTARTAALAQARSHRARAEDWARLAGIAGTAQDPRRVVYDLGATATDADTARTSCAALERRLADVYADALLASDADTPERTVLVDRLRGAALDQLRWGGTATALPGMDGLDGA